MVAGRDVGVEPETSSIARSVTGPLTETTGLRSVRPPQVLCYVDGDDSPPHPSPEILLSGTLPPTSGVLEGDCGWYTEHPLWVRKGSEGV